MDITNKTLIAYVFTILFVTSHVHCGTSASPPTHCATATATATSPSPPDGEEINSRVECVPYIPCGELWNSRESRCNNLCTENHQDHLYGNCRGIRCCCY
ncbi:hypothetical protein Bca4012_000491 [Brassica carinata]